MKISTCPDLHQYKKTLGISKENTPILDNALSILKDSSTEIQNEALSILKENITKILDCEKYLNDGLSEETKVMEMFVKDAIKKAIEMIKNNSKEAA